MAKIAIAELRPAGAELFEGSESFLQELTDVELDVNKGGQQDLFGLPSILSSIIFPQFPIPQLPFDS